MGMLIRGLGVDHVVWGTDAIWTGAPQWQIEALRRLEIPEDMQKQHGFTPHGPADAPYPGTCRPLPDGERSRRIAEGRRPALRIALPDRALTITDRICGLVSQQLAADVGDIIVRRSDGLYAYQLAVVVDDAADGVSTVVRGDDLLSSTPRQLAAYAALQRLGITTFIPRLGHISPVLDARGKKLSRAVPDASRRSARIATFAAEERVDEQSVEANVRARRGDRGHWSTGFSRS